MSMINRSMVGLFAAGLVGFARRMAGGVELLFLPLFGVSLALLVGTASGQTILTNANAPALTVPGVGVQTFTTTSQGNYLSLNLGAITFSGPSGVRVENLYAGQYNAIGNYLNNNNGTN